MRGNYKIYFVSLTYPPYIGGAEKQMSLLAEELKKKGVEIKVFTMAYPGRTEEDYIISSPCFGKPFSPVNKLIWFVFLFFQLLFLTKKSTIIYSFGYGFDKYVIYFMKKIKKISYIIKLPGTWDAALCNKIKKDFKSGIKASQYKIILTADKVVVQDTESIKNLKNIWNVNETRIAMIRNGVRIFAPRRRAAIHNLLFAGRLVKEKGIYELLSAFRELKREGLEIQMKIVGDGPELSAISERYKNDDIFFTGGVRDIDKFYDEADLFLLPTYREGFPNVVLEAMAKCLPVVVSPVGVLPEIFEDNKHLFFIEPGSVESIKLKIKWLYGHPEIAGNIGFQAYEKVKEEFSTETNCMQNMELFNNVLAEA